MPFNADTNWVHSFSPDNKNPAKDLGGVPSNFELSVYPMNNLFCDISPQKAQAGLIDYRCFYIFNKSPTNYIHNVEISMSLLPGGSTINFGSVLADDTQQIVITPNISTETPDFDGYIILDTSLGPPISVYWYGSIANMATDFQKKLRAIPICANCTVTGQTFTGAAGWALNVTFTGAAGNRYLEDIVIVANRLNSTGGGYLRVLGPGSMSPVQCSTDTSPPPINPPNIAFVPFISSIPVYPQFDPSSYPASGVAFCFNKCLNEGQGGFQPVNYISITLSEKNGVECMSLNLPVTLGYAIEEQDEVYIKPIYDNKFIVAVNKVTDGSPINTIAEGIPVSVQSPDNLTLGTSLISLGWLRPLEGFPIWIQRITSAGQSPMSHDGFGLSLTGSVYDS